MNDLRYNKDIGFIAWFFATYIKVRIVLCCIMVLLTILSYGVVFDAASRMDRETQLYKTGQGYYQHGKFHTYAER